MNTTISRMMVYQIRVDGEQWLWLALETADGTVGWGDASDSGDDTMVAYLLMGYESHLVGRQIPALETTTRGLAMERFPAQTVNRWESTAISAIDQAVWDLRAQRLGIPLYASLGAARAEAIPLYANLNRALKADRSPTAYAQAAQEASRHGFSVVKCTPFDEVTPDQPAPNIGPGLARLEAVLDDLPLAQIAIDCHARFHMTTLPRFMEALPQEAGPYWIEDPMAPSLWRQSAMAAGYYSGMRWAGGEMANSLAESLTWMDMPGLSVLMPDVKHVGGVTVVRTVMAVAECRGIWVSCHNPSSPLATAASAHLTTLTAQTIPLEYPWGNGSWRQQATIPAEPVRGGAYHLSTNPGIGIAPNPDFLFEYGWKWTPQGGWKALRTITTVPKGGF